MYKTKMEALHGAVGRYVENRKREIQEEQKRQSKNSHKQLEENNEYSIKRLEDWKKGSLYDFLQVGDQVDEEFYNYFINTLPPVTFWSTLVQMGEPYSHVDGKATFETLSKEEGVWVYKGHCFKGSREQVKSVS